MPYISISRETQDKVKLAKKFIQDKYQSLIQTQKKTHDNWKNIINLMNKNKIPSKQQQIIYKQYHNQQQIKKRLMRQKDSLSNYQLYKLIGKGAFGQVRLAKNIHTNEIVAIKRMQKKTLANKKQLSSAYLQRDFMIKNQNSKYLVHLHSTFQDKRYLYIVMDYIGGGDLLHLLIQKDIFTEQQTKFYIAELILALEQIHSQNYIHRDIKPDNILIDKYGHIKISDFGLSKYIPTQISQQFLTIEKDNKKQSTFASTNYKQSIVYQTQTQTHRTKNTSKNKNKQYKKATITIPSSKKATGTNTPQQHKLYKAKFQKLKILRNQSIRKYSKVGTPDYISPQVLTSDTYDFSVDVWSVGVIMFECLFGYPPFSDDDSSQVCQKVINWIDYLIFPQQIQTSLDAKMLILGMMNDKQNRLSIKQIKKHEFFKDIDWNNIKPPMIPIIQNQLDTRNFQNYQEQQNWKQKYQNDQINQQNYYVRQINYQQDKKQDQLTKDSFATSYKKQRKRSSSVDFAFPGFQYRKLQFQPFKQIQNQIRNFRKSHKVQGQNRNDSKRSAQYKQYKKMQLRQSQMQKSKLQQKKIKKYLIKSPSSTNKIFLKQNNTFSATDNSFADKNLNYSIDKYYKQNSTVLLKKLKKITPLQTINKINLHKSAMKKKHIKTQMN